MAVKLQFQFQLAPLHDVSVLQQCQQEEGAEGAAAEGQRMGAG